MRSDKILVYLFLGLLVLLPLVALPFLGAEFIVAVDGRSQQEEERLPPDDGEPVRLVTNLLVNRGGGNVDLIAILDLKTRNSAALLCKQSPYLRDALTAFVVENPSRLTQESRIPGKDPVLLRELNAAFPDVSLLSTRIGDPDSYKDLYPSRDVYECAGLSYRRIAKRDQ